MVRCHCSRIVASASVLIASLALFASSAEAQFRRNQGILPPTSTSKEATKPEAAQSKPAQNAAGTQTSAGAGKTTLESLKTPPGAVVVVCEQAQEALQLIPKAVVLAPEEYERLLDQIEKLKRQLKPDRAESPSACRLSGRVEDGLVNIHAKFEFKTARPRTLVNLGCQRAWPTAASLDGQLPWIQTGDEGYVVQVDEPGAHQATLDLVLPLNSRKGGRNVDQGFDLDLPRSAITLLEQFDLPAGLAEVKLGAQVLRPNQTDPQHTRIANLPINPSDHLEMTWRGPAAAAAKGPAVLGTTGHLVVRLDQSTVVIDAELVLEVLRGMTAEWQISVQLPVDATLEVRPHPQDEPQAQVMIRSADKANRTVNVRLKEPSSESLRIIFHIRQPRKEHAITIPSLFVLNALSQKGEIEVRAPANMRLRYEMGRTVSPRSLSDSERREGARAAFNYWNLPAPAPQDTAPLMTLESETVKGAAETRVTHLLRMVKSGTEDISFQSRTKIDVTPVRTAIDHMELALPAGYHYDKNEGPAPVDLVEDLSLDSTGQLAIIKLAQKQTRPFSITIAGSYSITKGQTQLSLELPRPVAWGSERIPVGGMPAALGSLPMYDRGGLIKVTLAEGLELTSKWFRLSSDPGVPNPLQSLFMSPRGKVGIREYTWQPERMPPRVDLSWQEYRPELSVQSVADVALTERQARIHHRLRFHSGQAGLSQALLRVPAGLEGKVRMLGGGTLQKPLDNIQTELVVNFTRPAAKEQEIELEYIFPLPGWVEADNRPGGNPPPSPESNLRGPAHPDSPGPRMVRRFALPLVQPALATGGETKVRVWSDWADQPAAVGGQWEELPTEIVNDRESLPALVLQGGLNRSLSLWLTRTLGESGAAALIDRILVRVEATQTGVQSYRCKFLLNQVNARDLDIDLPALLPRSSVEVRLGGNVVPFHLINDAGKDLDVGRRLRLRLPPHLVQAPILLEVKYEVDATRIGTNGPLQSTFVPPRIHNGLFLGRLRWEIHLPGGWLPVRAGPVAAVEQRWGWSGWLWAPQPAFSPSALEQWIQKSERLSPTSGRGTGLVAWQAGPEPLQLWQAPQRIWLLGCSLLVLGLGFLLLFARLSRLVFWSFLIALGMAAVALEFLWPGVLPVIAFGCEPGLLVLVLVMVLYAVLQHRHRRRVVLLPGFTRVKTGSSPAPSAVAIKPRDGGPVEELPRRGSSVSSKVGV
jgi:hypothetical protein